jgi:hypothetical protein
MQPITAFVGWAFIDWAGIDWAGIDWAGIDRAGIDWAGLPSVILGVPGIWGLRAHHPKRIVPSFLPRRARGLPGELCW